MSSIGQEQFASTEGYVTGLDWVLPVWSRSSDDGGRRYLTLADAVRGLLLHLQMQRSRNVIDLKRERFRAESFDQRLSRG